MKIQSNPPSRPPLTSRSPKPPDPAPSDRVELGPPGGPTPEVAWKSLGYEPRLFGDGLTSSLLMAVCGPIAVAVSKSGEAVEKIGQRFGWWDQLGSVNSPLPSYKLRDLPPSRLQRPILLVPGFHTPKNRFDHLVEKLTENGANGGRAYYVSNGQFFADLACTQQIRPGTSDGRVFVAVFPATNTPPHESAQDLKRSLEAICELTGQPKVDVTGYSMGGQATRVYLDQGGEAIGKFMMLGTPNQGSALARTSLGLLDLQRWGYDTDWLVTRKPLSQEDRAALGWLLPVSGGSVNPQLSDLNSRWESQRSQVEAFKLLGSNSRFTLGRYFIPDVGDGTVTARSLRLGDEKTTYLSDSSHRNHGLLFSNPQTYLEMRDFFGWNT